MPGFFAEEFLTDVLARNDIVDVIGQYVQLKRKGQSWWGLCPFHGEKTPSFSVSQDKQFYYCFGCHAGGNAFQFIQNIEKCDFSEAVELLASRAGLPMPERKSDGDHRAREELRTTLYEIGRAAARFYHDKLYSREGLPALEYLQKRGLSERIIKRFGLGYAPDNRDEAIRFLEAQGFSREHLKQFAVAGEKDGRWYAYFRNRVMFPIIDRRGRVIAFGGRVMDGSQPKYLNSPETPVFNKRQNLFGLNLVQQIRNLQRVVLVEGYMDVISMHQAGVPYAMASLGTALTEEQARLIKRYCEEVLLAYDGDAAGQKATLRGLDILRDSGLAVKVMEFPDGMDPDDYAKRFGLTGLEERMDQALPLIDYKLKVIAADCDLATEDGRRRYVTVACREVLAKITSPVELDIYVKRLSRQTGVSELAIYEESGIERSARKAAEYSAKHSRYTNAGMDGSSRMLEASPMEGRRDNASRDAESFLLRLAMHGSEAAMGPLLEAGSGMFSGERLELAEAVLNGQAKRLSTAEMMSGLSPAGQAELARIHLLALPPEAEWERLVDDCLRALRERKLEAQIEAVNEALKQQGLGEEERQSKKKELYGLLQKLSAVKLQQPENKIKR